MIAASEAGAFVATVPATDPLGPSVVFIDEAAEIRHIVHLDAEAEHLALSDDGSILWLSQEASNQIYRIDVGVPVPQVGEAYPLPDEFGDPGVLVVLPGTTESVAVICDNITSSSVVIFDGGVARPVAFDTTWITHLAQGPGSWLYGYNSDNTGFEVFALDVFPSGVTGSEFEDLSYGFHSNIAYDGTFIHTGAGHILDLSDPSNPQIHATLTGRGLMLPRADASRIHVLDFPQWVSESGVSVKNFNAETFAQLEEYELPWPEVSYFDFTTLDGDPLAVLEPVNGSGRLRLLDNPFEEPPGGPCEPLVCEPPNVCGVHPDGCGGTLECGPCGDATELLQPRHVLADPSRGRSYATLWGDAPHYANQVAIVDADTNLVVDTFPVESNPDEMALSDDGSTLWVATDGSVSVQRIDLSTDPPTPGVSHPLPTELSFTARPHAAGRFIVLPGTTDSLLVPLHRLYSSPTDAGLVVLDAGMMRPDFETWDAPAAVLGGEGPRFYGWSSGPDLHQLDVDAEGVVAEELETPVDGYGYTATYEAERVFVTNGRVIDVSEPAGIWPAGHINNEGPVVLTTEGDIVAAVEPVPFQGVPASVRRIDPDSFVGLEEHALPQIEGGALRDLGAPSPSTFVMITETDTGSRFESFANPFADPDVPALGLPMPHVHHVIADGVRARYYASVWAGGTNLGNRIVEFDVTGTPLDSWLVGSNPSALALSDDQMTLWVALDGSLEVAEYDLSTDPPTEVTRFRLPEVSGFFPFIRVGGLYPLPGPGSSVAAATFQFEDDGPRGVRVFDDGVMRPQGYSTQYIDVATPGPGPLVLGFHNTLSDPLVVFDLSDGGYAVTEHPGLINAGNDEQAAWESPYFFASTGEVVDVTNPQDPQPFADLGNNLVFLPHPLNDDVLAIQEGSNPIVTSKTIRRYQTPQLEFLDSVAVPELEDLRVTDLCSVDGSTYAVIGHEDYEDSPGTLFILDNPFEG